MSSRLNQCAKRDNMPLDYDKIRSSLASSRGQFGGCVSTTFHDLLTRHIIFSYKYHKRIAVKEFTGFFQQTNACLCGIAIPPKRWSKIKAKIPITVDVLIPTNPDKLCCCC